MKKSARSRGMALILLRIRFIGVTALKVMQGDQPFTGGSQDFFY